jgi:hypothetical protein
VKLSTILFRSLPFRSVFLCLIAVVCFSLLSAEYSVETTSASQEPRRNVARFLAKARSGTPVTVGFVGGSVTAGYGLSDPGKNSYRSLVMQWLKQRYGQTKVAEINASVAGAGSTYAAMRVRRDCIAHKPDLVFVEFASDDAGEKDDVVRRSLEGIVRQLLTVPQPPEIMFVYVPYPGRPNTVEASDLVAAYYRIPSIRVETMPAMWKDGLSLGEEGARLIARTVTDRLAEDDRQSPLPPVKVPAPPVFSDELTYGELIPFAQLKHEATWKTEAVSDRSLPSTLLVSDKPGSQIETFFEGTVVGIAFRAGPEGGILECLIDGRPAPAPLNRIDTYDPVNRLSTRVIAGGLGGGEHRLTIKVMTERNPKSSGSQARLGYLIVGGQRPERL